MFKIWFKLKALNAEKKINNLINHGIDVYCVERKEKSLTFLVDKKHQNEVLKFFEKEEISFEAQGIERFLEFLKIRLGLVFGGVFFLVMLILSSNVLISYDIQGNNYVQTSQIIDILSQNGYNKFNLSSSIDVKKVEECLLSSIPEISFASAMMKGNTLVINIREGQIVTEKDFSPLCAEFSGVISRINLKQGTACVKVGDVVKKGQVLVEAFEMNGENKIEVVPSAEVFAKVFIKGQVKYDLSQKVQGRTGDCYEERLVSFLGIDVKCQNIGDEEIKNQKHEKVIEEEFIDGIVPFKITKTKYFLVGDVAEPDFERDKLLLEKESVYLAFEQIIDNFEIKSQSTQILQIENVYYVTTYLEIEKNIIEKRNSQ